MDSQELIGNYKNIIKDLFHQQKISGSQYKQLYSLMLEIRLKAASEWIMNDVLYQASLKKKRSSCLPGTQN